MPRRKLKPAPPTAAQIEECILFWRKNPKYQDQKQSLDRLFLKLCPRHDAVADVLSKVCVLNTIFGTNVYHPYEVAKHIASLRVRQRIEDGDLTVVNEIALVPVDEKTVNFYSFASKYCHRYNPEKFPIYDSFVEKMLMHFRKSGKKDGFAQFKRGELKQYPRFVKILGDFRAHYGLKRFTFRQIDHYFWHVGRKAFANYQTKKKRRSNRRRY